MICALQRRPCAPQRRLARYGADLASPIDCISLQEPRAKEPREGGILPIAPVLTTIYVEVVKIAAIGKFSHDSMRVPRSLGSLASRLLLSESCSPEVLLKRPSLKELGKGFAGIRFTNGASFDHDPWRSGQNWRYW